MTAAPIACFEVSKNLASESEKLKICAPHVQSSDITHVYRPVKSYSRALETIHRGPYDNLIPTIFQQI